MTTPIKILIVEDHELTRTGLSVMLKERDNLNVVGEAENGQKACELAMALAPDVILMDIGLPIMDGIEATQKIKLNNPNIKVVILTSRSSGEDIFASLASGAEAYCLKDIKLDRLSQVIETVHEGAIWLDPTIASTVMKALPSNNPNHMAKNASREQYRVGLTQRELEVLELIVDGKSNQEIAERLVVTIHTVKAHVANIIQKLAVDDRTQAAVKALREGIVAH